MAESGLNQIAIVKSAVLDFVNDMGQEKRDVEQQIRERIESVKSQFLSSGATQFSYAQVDDLVTQYRDEFISFYQNTIHMKLLANASSHLRRTLEFALVNSGVVQEDLVNSMNQLQSQIDQAGSMAQKLGAAERTIDEQAQKVSELTEGHILTQADMEQFEVMLADKDRLMAEKDQEIFNLSEGLSRLESQVNTMGATMLENNLTMEDQQSLLAEQDVEIENLKAQLQNRSTEAPEVSGELVDQLQENLEKARSELLTVRKELVSKNDELYELKLEHDESDTKLKKQGDRLSSLKDKHEELLQEKETLEKDLNDLKASSEDLAEKYTNSQLEMEELTQKVKVLDDELMDAKNKLAGYEGKETITAEEQQLFISEINDHKKRIKNLNDVISYFKEVLSQDMKFKVMLYLDSLAEEIRLDDLSTGIGLPQELIHRIIIELSESGQASTRKEGRNIFVGKVGKISPLALEAITA